MTFLNSFGKAMAASVTISVLAKGLGVAAKRIRDILGDRINWEDQSGDVFLTEEDDDRRERNIIFRPEYDSEDGEPSQDVAFVGDTPYVLIKLEGEGGSLVKIRAGGITPDSEPWVLQDATNAIVSVMHQKYVIECNEFEDED